MHESRRSTKKVGRKVREGKSCGTVESGKWVGAAKSAAGGEVIEANVELVNKPSIANEDPYGAGWMVILSPDDLGSRQRKPDPWNRDCRTV